MASGIPVVCTDVGSCYEIVHGHPKAHLTTLTTPPDPANAAGRIVPIADPGATAAAILDLLTDREAWMSARDVGIARVDSQYSEQLMLERYEHLYTEVTEGSRPVAAAGE